MSTIELRHFADFLNANTDLTIHMDHRGNISLTPDNHWPNQYWHARDPNGEPKDHDLSGLRPELVAYHTAITMPGAPRRPTLARQTSTGTPVKDGAYTKQGPWIPGVRGTASPAYRDVKPRPPVLDAIDANRRGFQGGRFGWAHFFGGRWGETSPTAYRFFDVLNMEKPVLPVPESFPIGTEYWGILLTQRNGDESTGRVQRRLDISTLDPGGTYDLHGPWVDRGRAKTVNASGLEPPELERDEDYRTVASRLDCLPGDWRPLIVLKNDRGLTAGGPLGPAIRIEPDLVRTRVPGPPPEDGDANASTASGAEPGGDGGGGGGLTGSGGSSAGDGDAREVRAWGKQEPGREYEGWELDHDEALLAGLLNERRKRDGASPLIISMVMNRAAYRRALDDAPPETPLLDLLREEGYEGSEATEASWRGDTPEGAAEALSGALSGSWTSLGIAREGGTWRVVVGEEIPYEEGEIPHSLATFGHVDEHGVFRAEEIPAEVLSRLDELAEERGGEPLEPEVVAECVIEGLAAKQQAGGFADQEKQEAGARKLTGWDLVQNGRLGWSYAGSHDAAVSSSALRWNALGSVRVEKGGPITCSIRDGSAPGNVMGYTSSDGKIVLDDYLMRKGTRNAVYACCGHEVGHAVRQDHTNEPSVMRTPITINGNNNVERPTAYDERSLVGYFGRRNAGGGNNNNGKDIRRRRRRNRRRGGDDSSGRGPDSRRPEPKDPEPKFHMAMLPGKYKEATALFCETPGAVRRNPLDVEWTVYWQREAWTDADENDEPASVTWYRAYPVGRSEGTAAFFSGGEGSRFEEGVEVNGYAPDEAPEGLHVRLIEEEPPLDNTTGIEPPDPTAVPDVPTTAGIEQMPTGPYLAAVQGVLRGGGLTALSEPSELTLAPEQLLRVEPQPSVNLLRDAEFSKRDANGRPEHWTFTPGTSGGFDVEGEPGVLRLFTTTQDSASGTMESTLISVSGLRWLTVGGTVGASPVGGSLIGGARLVLKQYREDGTQGDLAEHIVGQISAAGQVDFERRFLEDGQQLRDNCSHVSIEARLFGATRLLNARFFDLYVVPFPVGIRKISDDAATPFVTTPDTPYPSGSYAKSGLPRTSEELETVAPVELITFDAGAVPPSWTPATNAAPTIDFDATDPIHGTRSLRIRSTLGTNRQFAYWQRHLTSMDGDKFAARSLFRWGGPPTHGYVDFHPILFNSGALCAWLRLYSTGKLFLVYVDPGAGAGSEAEWEEHVGFVGGRTLLDAETRFETGRRGLLALSIGRNGEARELAFEGSPNYEGKSARGYRLGTFWASDARGRYDFRQDQVAFTRLGDVQRREKPGAPAGVTALPPDRPTRNGLPREADEDGRSIRQIAIFVAPGDGTPGDPARIPLLERPMPVRPGLTYGVGIFWRHAVFTDRAAPGIRVWFEGPGEERRIAARLGEMDGVRGWHPSASGGVATEHDDHATFTVPLDGRFTHVRVEAVLHDGFYVFQEPVFHVSKKADPSFGARDSNRGYGRAESGVAEFIADTLPEAHELGLQVPVFYGAVGVRTVRRGEPHELGVGAHGNVAIDFATSHDGYLWEPYEDTEDEARRYLRWRIRLERGASRRGPVIPHRGVFAETWMPRFGYLLREDGSHFPGVAYVNPKLVYVRYPDHETARVGGHHQTIPEGDEIGRLYSIKIGVYTEAALRQIEHLAVRERLRVLVPHAGGELGGHDYLIRARSHPTFSVTDFADSLREGHRWLEAHADIPEAQVLEVAERSEPLEPVALPPAPPWSEGPLGVHA